jgi:hypothetical protein
MARFSRPRRGRTPGSWHPARVSQGRAAAPGSTLSHPRRGWARPLHHPLDNRRPSHRDMFSGSGPLPSRKRASHLPEFRRSRAKLAPRRRPNPAGMVAVRPGPGAARAATRRRVLARDTTRMYALSLIERFGDGTTLHRPGPNKRTCLEHHYLRRWHKIDLRFS